MQECQQYTANNNIFMFAVCCWYILASSQTLLRSRLTLGHPCFYNFNLPPVSMATECTASHVTRLNHELVLQFGGCSSQKAGTQLRCATAVIIIGCC